MDSTFERWAAAVVENELGAKTELNDDRSKNGMYDLRIGSATNPEYAIECVGAVDSVAIETWNIGPAKGPIQTELKGDWLISIARNTRVNNLRKEIFGLLDQCEKEGLVDYTPVDWQLKKINRELSDKLESLGILSINRFRFPGQGLVHMSMDGCGGAVSQDGVAFVNWIGSFLRDRDQKDVLEKLERSQAIHRHVFIPIVMEGAPWSVMSYFIGDMPVPDTTPDLPETVDGVWVVFQNRGIRYAEGKWHIFSC